jgi:hypothetical protein
MTDFNMDELVQKVAERTGSQTAKMHYVEKFLPPECPKCRAAFKTQDADWQLLLGDIINGVKTVRPLDGYDIIICAHCGNHTIRLKLETYQLFDKAKAEELVEKEGFVNLQEVLATGTHCRDMHAIYMKMPGIKVRGIKCDGEEDK